MTPFFRAAACPFLPVWEFRTVSRDGSQHRMPSIFWVPTLQRKAYSAVMKRWAVLMISVIIVCIVLAAIRVLILCRVQEAEHPVFHLLTVRQTNENGRTVVFFKVTGASTRRIQLTGAVRVFGDREESLDNNTAGKEFLAPSQVWPLGNVFIARKPFGVLAPTNVPSWKLKVHVYMEDPNPLHRLAMMPATWKWGRRLGKSMVGSASFAWNAFLAGGYQWVESDWMTNGIPDLSTSGIRN